MSLVLSSLVFLSAGTVGLALLHALFKHVWPRDPDNGPYGGFLRTTVGNLLFVGVSGGLGYLVMSIPASLLPLAVVVTIPVGATAAKYLLTA